MCPAGYVDDASGCHIVWGELSTGELRTCGVTITGWLIDVTGTYTAGFALAAGISVAATLTFMAFGRGQPIVLPERSPR